MPLRIPIYQRKISVAEPAFDGIDYPAVPGIETVSGVLRVPVQESGKGRIVRVAIMPESSGPEPRPNDCWWMVPIIGDNWILDDPAGWSLGDGGDLHYHTGYDDGGAVFRYADSMAEVTGDFVWELSISLTDYDYYFNDAGMYIFYGNSRYYLYYSQAYSDTIIFAGPGQWNWIGTADISDDFDPNYDTLYLRMSRVSGLLTGSYSLDNTNWTAVGSVACAYTSIGIFAQIYWQNDIDFRMRSLTPCPPEE